MITAVVWLRALDGGWYEGTPENGLPFVHQSALDAMTAERDELRERVKTWQWEAQILRDERDSARDMLRAIRDSTYRDAVTLRGMADNFLAAQPETKP